MAYPLPLHIRAHQFAYLYIKAMKKRILIVHRVRTLRRGKQHNYGIPVAYGTDAKDLMVLSSGKLQFNTSALIYNFTSVLRVLIYVEHVRKCENVRKRKIVPLCSATQGRARKGLWIA